MTGAAGGYHDTMLHSFVRAHAFPRFKQTKLLSRIRFVYLAAGYGPVETAATYNIVARVFLIYVAVIRPASRLHRRYFNNSATPRHGYAVCLGRARTRRSRIASASRLGCAVGLGQDAAELSVTCRCLRCRRRSTWRYRDLRRCQFGCAVRHGDATMSRHRNSTA